MRISNEEYYRVKLLQRKAEKPKQELIEILHELEGKENTSQRTKKLESIISRLDAWQNT